LSLFQGFAKKYLNLRLTNSWLENHAGPAQQGQNLSNPSTVAANSLMNQSYAMGGGYGTGGYGSAYGGENTVLSALFFVNAKIICCVFCFGFFFVGCCCCCWP
jgi:hypothetical protein